MECNNGGILTKDDFLKEEGRRTENEGRFSAGGEIVLERRTNEERYFLERRTKFSPCRKSSFKVEERNSKAEERNPKYRPRTKNDILKAEERNPKAEERNSKAEERNAGKSA
eukprot:gene17219-biopygen10649